MKAFSRYTVLAVIPIVTLGWIHAASTQGQAPQGLPQGFGDLAPAEFVTQANALKVQGGLTGQALVAVRSHANTLFEEIELAQTQLNYQTLLGLYELAHPRYEWLYTTDDAASKQAAREAFLSRQDNWTGKPYEELQAKFRLMVWLKASREDRMQEVRNWLAADHTLADMWPEELGMVRQALGEYREIDGGFSAVWEGTLTAPQTGNYTFYISPINPYYHTDGTNGPLLTYNEKRHRDSFDPPKSVTVSVGGASRDCSDPQKMGVQIGSDRADGRTAGGAADAGRL